MKSIFTLSSIFNVKNFYTNYIGKVLLLIYAAFDIFPTLATNINC